MKEKSRLLELDLLRFIAASAVMVFHYSFRGMVGHPFYIFHDFLPIGAYTKYGFFGVHLFFIISGFVILMTAYNKSAHEFVISRMVRLYPVYWICCCLTFLITYSSNSIPFKYFLANLTMIHELRDIPSVDGSYWTLLIEIKFYLLVFLLIIFGQIKNIKYFLGLWLFASIFLTIYPNERLVDWLIPTYSAFFIAGAMFYLIYVEGSCLYKNIILLTSFFFGTYKAILVSQSMVKRYLPIAAIVYDPIVICFILASFYAIFYLLINNKFHFLRFEGLKIIGWMTYPLYLIHQQIGYLMINAFVNHINIYLLLILVCLFMYVFAFYLVKLEKFFSPKFKLFLENVFSLIKMKIAFK